MQMIPCIQATDVQPLYIAHNQHINGTMMLNLLLHKSSPMSLPFDHPVIYLLDELQYIGIEIKISYPGKLLKNYIQSKIAYGRLNNETRRSAIIVYQLQNCPSQYTIDINEHSFTSQRELRRFVSISEPHNKRSFAMQFHVSSMQGKHFKMRLQRSRHVQICKQNREQ